MQPETIFMLAVAVAVVVIVLAVRRTRKQKKSIRDAVDLVVDEANWPDWW